MLSDSIFWVDADKIKPNPYQPRREFDEAKLQELAESIRQYGILQPLVVTRKEIEREDGGLEAQYELIAGERRLRASKIAGVSQVPVIIRLTSDEEGEKIKLELAIIENVQREDLNPVDRARAFKKLVQDFDYRHVQISKRIGKSREYVSNSIRLLSLPEEMVRALSEGHISEGHARPLLMLVERPDEQTTLFKEILYKKLTVREAERIARHTAVERARKKSGDLDPELLALEERLTENLGTRVQIERREMGGKVMIDFYSPEDLRMFLRRLEQMGGGEILKEIVESPLAEEGASPLNESSGDNNNDDGGDDNNDNNNNDDNLSTSLDATRDTQPGTGEDGNDEDDLYSIRNFTI